MNKKLKNVIHGVVTAAVTIILTGVSYFVANTDQVAALLLALGVPPASIPIAVGVTTTTIAKFLPSPLPQKPGEPCNEGQSR